MRRLRPFPLLTALVLSLVASGATAQPDAADEVELWLDRMNVAVEELNYRGTYVHVVGNNAETLNIVHRYADGESRQKISSPEGSGREIILTPEIVLSVFPEKELVVLEEPDASSIPFAASLPYSEELQPYYEFRTVTKGRVAERDTQVISIRAKDEYRYGYLLYLDGETALPLRSEVRDEEGRVVELILFTELRVIDSIPQADVEPSVDIDRFEWRRPVQPETETPSTEIWGATRLPNGFRLSLARQSLLAGSKYPVQHLVYTDGLATVSVFIAHPLSDADMTEGFSRYGSTNAYSLKIDGRLATAMGEVPRRTVQRIATSLDAQ